MYICTYFDSAYFTRGLALYKSLARNAIRFHLWVLCLDDLTYKTLRELKLPGVHLISKTDFEYGDSRLLLAKKNRSRVEYYWTCTPSLILYVLRNCPEVDVITYIDADLFFFSDPSPLYKELSDNSILVVEHRSLNTVENERYGIYNVSFLIFRRDCIALTCLERWRDQCLEWCYDRVEDGRYGDQKYLDDWPTQFERVGVLQHKGANLGPWSIMYCCLKVDNGLITVDSQPLISFHFSDFKQVAKSLYIGGRARAVNSKLKQLIYGVYIKELQQAERLLTMNGVEPNKDKLPLRKRFSLVRSLLGPYYQFLIVIGSTVI